MFIERWSPRSFSPECIPLSDLTKIIDAARWSPSTLNEQPWLFFTAEKDSSTFKNFIACLSEGNQIWARNAPVLGFLVARNFFKNRDKENLLAGFDCGAAWMALTIQARFLGYYTHGMGGIDREMIKDLLVLNEKEHKVIMGFALGKKADSKFLPQKLQGKEFPSERENIDKLWKQL